MTDEKRDTKRLGLVLIQQQQQERERERERPTLEALLTIFFTLAAYINEVEVSSAL
jgi:hypothetical protein